MGLSEVGGPHNINYHHFDNLTVDSFVYQEGFWRYIIALSRNSDTTLSSHMPDKWVVSRLLHRGIVTSCPINVPNRSQKNDNRLETS